MVPSRAVCAAALLAAALTGPAAAQPPEHWIAASKTAMSITGNVRFSPTRITFSTGAWLPLRFVGTVGGLTWLPGDDGTAPADLYRITKPQNPSLVSGNGLCGAKALTWLSVARKNGEIFLTLYDVDALPTPKPDVSCAGYSYDPRKLGK